MLKPIHLILLAICGKIGGQVFNFISAYGPHDREEKMHSLKKLKETLKDPEEYDNVILGDPNIALEENLDVFKARQPLPGNVQVLDTLKTIMLNFSLSDWFREFNPQRKDYTYYHHNGQKTRIDHIIGPSGMTTTPNWFIGHKGVQAIFFINSMSHGKGYWPKSELLFCKVNGFEGV